MEQKPGTILSIQRNIFFTGLTSFLTDTTTKMVYAVMPLFLLSIGASKTELSLIEGIAESTASLLKALSGWLSDHVGRNKPFMLAGYAFTALLSPLFGWAQTPMQVLGIRFAERVGKGIRTAPRDSLIAASAAPGGRGRGFGFHKAMDNSGAIAGPLLAFAILAAFPGEYRRVFWLSALPGLAGVFILVLFVKEVRSQRKEHRAKPTFRDFPLRFYALMGVVFVFTLGNSTDALLLVKAADVGIPAALIPLVYLVFNSISVAASVPLGILLDRFGRERFIIGGYLLYAGVYCGFGLAGSPWAVVAFFALYGLYSAATDGIQKALVSDLIDSGKQGTGLGIYNGLLGATLLPASLIAGVLYDRVDNRAPFFFGAAMALLAAVLMGMLYWRWHCADCTE